MSRVAIVTMWLAIHSLSAAPLQAQQPQAMTPQARVEADLVALIASCRTGDFATAAARVIYHGEDRARQWRDVFNSDVPEELAEVRELCQMVIEYDPQAEGYTVRRFLTQTESEGTWHALVVEYIASGAEVLYAFLEIEGVFALGDID